MADEKILERSDAVAELTESVDPRPIWTPLDFLDPAAATNDARWSAWTQAWVDALCATSSNACAHLRGGSTPEQPQKIVEQSSALKRWAPWIVTAAAIVGVTAAVAVTSRELTVPRAACAGIRPPALHGNTGPREGRRTAMKIFDGVELKQTPSSGIQNWLSVAMLMASSFLEADKCRQERLAGGLSGPAPSPNTLEEVMAQAGLKIPALEEALGQLMGGSDEAKQAAAMIARAPEPGKLLQQFAKQFGFSGPANTGPVVTPPPAARPAVAESPSFRPEFTREARQAARAAAADAGEPPSFRPEFTREARQAERAAATVSPAATAGPGPVETSQPSLVTLVEGQLAALRQRMKAHEEVIDARLKRAESELAAMRQELEQRSLPTPTVVPAEEGDTAGHATPEPEVATAVRPAPEVARDAVARPVEVVAAEPMKVEQPHELSVGSASAVTEEQVAQAVGLISAFAQEVEERHQQQLAHVDAVEHEVQVLRSKIAAQAANYA